MFAAGALRVPHLGADGPIEAGKHANIARSSLSCRNIIVSRDARDGPEPISRAVCRGPCARKQIRLSRVVYGLVLFGLRLIQRYPVATGNARCLYRIIRGQPRGETPSRATATFYAFHARGTRM